MPFKLLAKKVNCTIVKKAGKKRLNDWDKPVKDWDPSIETFAREHIPFQVVITNDDGWDFLWCTARLSSASITGVNLLINLNEKILMALCVISWWQPEVGKVWVDFKITGKLPACRFKLRFDVVWVCSSISLELFFLFQLSEKCRCTGFLIQAEEKARKWSRLACVFRLCMLCILDAYEGL